jgi:hypothetical protein
VPQQYYACADPRRSVLVVHGVQHQTRSILETDQKLAGLDSNQKGIKKNADGSVTVWIGPKSPAGQENNWVQTMPGKGWNSLLRLYAPLEPWFDKSWKPGDFELVE